MNEVHPEQSRGVAQIIPNFIVAQICTYRHFRETPLRVSAGMDMCPCEIPPSDVPSFVCTDGATGSGLCAAQVL